MAKLQCVFIKLKLKTCEWFTCSFDDLPHSCRCGRHHGSLVQAQLPDIHNMETVHVFLWSDGVTHCALVDVLLQGRKVGKTLSERAQHKDEFEFDEFDLIFATLCICTERSFEHKAQGMSPSVLYNLPIDMLCALIPTIKLVKPFLLY